MRTLTAKDLLNAWEKCLDEPVALRASTLLAYATGEVSPGETAQWTIAERDAGLIALREQLFGGSVEAVASCPNCGEQSEVEFALEQIRVAPRYRARQARKKTIRVAGTRVRYRAPTSEDLLSIARLGDREAATKALLERCIEIADKTSTDPSCEAISEAIATRVAECIARDEAQADVELKFVCPGCGHEWETVFDIASFLWSEVDDWARRIFGEVDAIARRYGWREADILSMSARRRHSYLELIAT